MRRFVWVLMLLVVVMAAGVMAQERAALPLQVIDSDPLAGEEMGLQTPITLYFDRAVDCETAREAITIEPALRGRVVCDEDARSVQFIPLVDYERDTSYTLQADTSLTGMDGAQLEESFTLALNTQGFLQITEFLPEADAAGVLTGTTVTLIFNRPVVPLSTSVDFDEQPHPLTIEPGVTGEGEWISTSVYLFTPDDGFLPNTEYTVTVEEGLTAFDGAQVEDELSWSFSTVEPQIRSVAPGDGAGNIWLDQKLGLTFTYPIDQALFEDNFFLMPSPANLPADEMPESVSGTFEWFDNGFEVEFTPDEQLELDTVYRAGVRLGEDQVEPFSLLLGGQTQWTFSTLGLPEISGTFPDDEDFNIYPPSGFSIDFSSPMNTETVSERVSIDPEPEFVRTFERTTRVTFSFPVQPRTTYTVTIEPGMEDIYGNVVEEGRTVTFTTSGLSSSMLLNVPGSIGFYNGNYEDVGLYITRRNIDQFTMQLYSIPVEEFASTITDNYSLTSGFTPDESRLIRDWFVQLEPAEDVYLPDFINVSEAAVCDNAPDSRLRVGTIATLADDIATARAFYEPAGSESLSLLFPDAMVPIVGGPSCINETLWWEVEIDPTTTAWVAENAGGDYILDLADDLTTSVVPVSDEDGRLPPGVYYLRVAGRNHVMMVMTANLTVKATPDSVLVWATDVQTGEPIPRAPITIYDQTHGEIARGITDENGLVRIDTPLIDNVARNARVALLESDEHLGVGASYWADGIDPGMFDYGTNYAPDDYSVYVYTDRPIYRPEQSVYFRAVVRANDDLTYTVPDFDSLPVQVRDMRGDIVFSEEVELTRFGTLSGEFELADDAPLGGYFMSVLIPTGAEDSVTGGSVNFSVAEYRLPEFQVDVQPEFDEVANGDLVQVLTNAAYFFGGPVSNGRVEYDVIASPYRFVYTGEGRYRFGRFSDFGGFEREITEGVGTTNAGGEYLIEFPADLQFPTQSVTYTVEATVNDEADQTVSGRTSVVVHAGEIYVGAQPERYIGRVNEDSTINIIAVDWDSVGIAEQPIDINVIERRWNNVQRLDEETGRTNWEWEVEEILVTDGNVVTDAEGRAVFTFTPPRGGSYQIQFTTRDERGNEITSDVGLWVSSREYVSVRQEDNNRIELIADRDDYSVGDMAEILIASPFQGEATALITVERGDVLKSETVTLDSNTAIYQLPIEESYAPNVYVSVMIVKGVDETNPVAAFRMGLLQLEVDAEQKELNVEIVPDRERAAPDETVTYTVRTTNYEGEPVAAEVGVALTDLAALSITDETQTTLMRFFYSLQGLSVRTGTPLTINTDQITQNVLDTVKGGGGGGGIFGVSDIREEFVDTPYWNAILTTGADGEVRFDVALPDNLTTWRLDARAITRGNNGVLRVGQNTNDIISTRPLIVRPVTPRFFIVDDLVTLAAVVNNNTREDLEVEVAMDADGVILHSDAQQTITVPAEGRGRVEWQVTVEDVEQVDVVFAAQSVDGSYSDAARPAVGREDDRLLPVYRYEAPETIATAGLLDESGTRVEGIALPRRFVVEQGDLTVNLQTSLAATTLDGLDYLRDYPHLCVEQTVSRFLPNIMTYRALDALGVADEELERELRVAANLALQRLYAQQKSDGGWGWFVQDDSNPLTTAYALIGLVEAQREGFPVAEEVIGLAQGFLTESFIVPDLSASQWQLNRQAFILYALARSGQADIARTHNLYDERARLNLDAQAFLALTLHMIDPEDPRIGVLMADLVSKASVSASGIHWSESYRDYWNWSTDTRSTALALSALVNINPDSDLLPGAVRWLVSQRDRRAWETTQETAWSVMALTDWMIVTDDLNPDYTFSTDLNGETLTSSTASSATIRDTVTLEVQVSDLLSDEINRLAFERGAGVGNLYYTAYLNTILPVPAVEPLDRGLIIDRQYYRVGADDDAANEPITEARVGDLIEVRLTVIAPESRHYVVIEDPLPAGAEAVDPGLNTSRQIGTRPSVNRRNPLSRGWGWWWFSNIEFRDEQVNLYSTFLPAGTYEYRYIIRAGLAGEYNVIPPTGQEFYFPEVYGRGAGSLFTILPAE